MLRHVGVVFNFIELNDHNSLLLFSKDKRKMFAKTAYQYNNKF
jgi:hypothetical protein